MTDNKLIRGESVAPGHFDERGTPAPTATRARGAVAPECASASDSLVKLLARLAGEGLDGAVYRSKAVRAVLSDKHYERLLNFNKRLAAPDAWRDSLVLRRTSWSDGIARVQQGDAAIVAPLGEMPDFEDVAVELAGPAWDNTRVGHMMVKYATAIEAERVGFDANFHRMQARDKDSVGLWQARRITEMGHYYVSNLVEAMGALIWRRVAQAPGGRAPELEQFPRANHGLADHRRRYPCGLQTIGVYVSPGIGGWGATTYRAPAAGRADRPVGQGAPAEAGGVAAAPGVPHLHPGAPIADNLEPTVFYICADDMATAHTEPDLGTGARNVYVSRARGLLGVMQDTVRAHAVQGTVYLPLAAGAWYAIALPLITRSQLRTELATVGVQLEDRFRYSERCLGSPLLVGIASEGSFGFSGRHDGVARGQRGDFAPRGRS